MNNNEHPRNTHTHKIPYDGYMIEGDSLGTRGGTRGWAWGKTYYVNNHSYGHSNNSVLV